jgi:hypothetical protein
MKFIEVIKGQGHTSIWVWEFLITVDMYHWGRKKWQIWRLLSISYKPD